MSCITFRNIVDGWSVDWWHDSDSQSGWLKSPIITVWLALKLDACNNMLFNSLRYGELLAENCDCEFSLPHSHLTPSLGANPFKFLDEFFIPKTRVLGLCVGEDFVILACVVFTQCQRVTARQTDGRTDRRLADDS